MVVVGVIAINIVDLPKVSESTPIDKHDATPSVNQITFIEFPDSSEI